MMKAVRRHNPLWAGTGSRSAGVVGAIAGGEPASGQKGGVVVHGPAATPLDQGQGRVSDLTLRPQHASSQAGQGRRPLQNAEIPPITFPGGRNPYLDRPLPKPPSRNIAAATSTTTLSMPARPSTSSGPGSSKTAATKPNFDKRLSKDDMALTGQFGTGKERDMPPAARALWLLAPEPSPQGKRTPSPPRVLSPQSPASGEIQIGMALGSPTRDTTPLAGSPYVGSPQAGWLPQTQVTVQISHSPPLKQKPGPTVQRSKTQKRRLFGLFGSRKHAEPPKPAAAAEPTRSTSSTKPAVSNEGNVPARSNTVAGKAAPKHKPIIVKPRPEPQPQPEITVDEPSMPSISKPILSTPSSNSGLLDINIPDIRLERYSVMFSGVLNPNGTKSSLLERRQANLERLKTLSDEIESETGKEKTRPRRATSPQPMKSPAFSLFPQTPTCQSGLIVTSGAAMALTSSLTPHRGLTRSNTSPAYLPSPSRANFELLPQDSPEKPRKEKKTVTIISPRSMDERNRAAQVERLREQQLAQQQHQSRSHAQIATITTTFHFGPSESSLVLDSPDSDSSAFSSDDDEDDDRTFTHRRPLPSSLRPSLPEPEWQIITPPSSSTSSADSARSNITSTSTSTSVSTTTPVTSTTKRSASPSSSTSQTPSSSAPVSSRSSCSNTAGNSNTNPNSSTTRPSLDDARISVDEKDSALKAAVEISIARQISISRQQRRMLGPFGSSSSSHGGAAVRMGGVRGRSATVGGAVGTMGAGGEGKSMAAAGMIPEDEEVTVGVIRGRVTTPVMVGGGGVEHRRSERVVLDVA